LLGPPLSEARQFALEVVSRLRSAGFIALWAGGCVRDLLMEREPHDYDVATSATPHQVRELFGFRRTLMIGAAFGVVIIKGSSRLQEQVEVATFRTDATYTDGRRPDSVTFSTPEKDAERRDFTINGMFFDPVTGEVIDFVGGREDLRNGIIRAIGDPHARLAEDKLRMMRAIRFAARFSFSIDPETEAAVTAHAADVAMVSGERIAIEFRKTLETDRAAWAVDRWHATGLMQVIAPEIRAHWESVGDTICELLSHAKRGKWIARAAAMYWPIVAADIHEPLATAKECIASLKQRLKLANDEAEAMLFGLESQSILARGTQLAWSRVQPLLIMPHIDTALAILAARGAISSALEMEANRLNEFLHLPPEKLNPPPLLDGQDLQQSGLAPGPQFREILQKARDLQLDRVLTDHKSAKEWLLQRDMKEYTEKRG
jgi:tRNA nucleotidyltransferase/poly(A) polymerase